MDHKPSMLAAAGLICGLIATGLVTYTCSQREVDRGPSSALRQATSSAAIEGDAGAGSAPDSTNVEFRQSVGSGDEPNSSRGTPERLAAGQVELLAQHWERAAQAYEDSARELSKLPESEVTLEKLVEQSQLLKLREMSLAAVHQARAGKFRVLSAESHEPVDQPEGWSTMKSGPFLAESGVRVHIAISIDLSLRPIAAAEEAARSYREAAGETYMGLFNNMDYDQRRARWERHVAAVAGLASVRTNRQLGKSERVRRSVQLEADLIPNRFTVDQSYSLRLRR